MTDYLKTQAERDASFLAQSYAAWERNLRGWQIWNFAVQLEPVFSPIQFPTRPNIVANRDDARVPRGFGLFGRTQNTRQIVSPQPNQLLTNQDSNDLVQASSHPLSQPTPFYRNELLTELSIFLPKEFEVSPTVFEQFCLSLSSLPTPVSFEILADAENIHLQMACDNSLTSLIKNQLQTFFPTCVISERQNFLPSFLTDQTEKVIADFGLARNFLLPLQTFRSFNPDPLTGLISSLGNLQRGEKAVLQVLFQKAKGNWADEVNKLLANSDFKSIVANSAQSRKDKFSASLFAVAIRLMVESPNKTIGWQIIKQIGGNFSQFATPNGNELIALSNDGLSENNQFLSLLNRTSYRSGLLLNTNELVSFVHFPTAKMSKLKRDEGNTKAVPNAFLNYPFVLGLNQHQSEIKTVSLSEETRTRHLLTLGATGSGKTNALIHFALQDIKQGRGCAVFDVHGDLIDEIVANIPPERSQDVILFDPSDTDYPIGFNPLVAHSEIEKNLLTSDLIGIFRRFSTSWGDVMDSVLANTILAFVESEREGNLFDLKRFLLEKNFRNEFLSTVNDEAVKYFWQTEFPLIKGKPQSSILLRLDTFLRQKLVRNIICQKEKTLNFRHILDTNKIFLAKLSLGIIGEQNSFLLGTLLLAKLQQTALSRQDSQNRPFFAIYADEFHHLICPTISTLLSGIRKFRVGLSLFLQQFRAIQEKDSEVAASVLANCTTRICFRLGDEDAKRFENGFSFFKAEHLQNLPIGEAIARIERADYDFNLKIPLVTKVQKELAEQRRLSVLESSRKQFATPRVQVESGLFGQNVATFESVESPPIIEAPQTHPIQLPIEPEIRQTTPLGRGGQHHQQIQLAIKRMAESYGFNVEIEKDVLDGSGKIDVSLEKENLKIAAEVSVTTTDYEANNVRKCLASGYDFVIIVSSQKKKIPLLQRKVYEEISFAQRKQVKVLSLPDFFAFLREITLPKDVQDKKNKPLRQRMSFSEACQFFGIGSSTLYRWIREGRIPFYRIGREYHFDREELVLIGRHDLSGKRKAKVKLEPLRIEKTVPKSKKEEDLRYRKMLNLD